jgi:hypothetical protein
MNPGWWATLEGEDSYLRDLVEFFHDPDLRVIAESGAYYLGSARFAQLDDPKLVREEAVRLAAIAAGSASLELGPFRAPRVTRIVHIDADGHRQPHNAPISFEQPFRRAIQGPMEVTRPDGTVELVEGVPASRLPDYAGLAIADLVVEDALAILAREDLRWPDLYHVYELVQHSAGGKQAMISAGWTTDPEVKLFKRTANSRNALGRDARHGHDDPKNQFEALSPDEARKFVVKIVAAWLDTTKDLPERKMIEVPPPKS